jgi:hypothetical protein
MMALIIAMAMPMVAIAMDHGSHDKEMSKDMDHDKHKAHDMKMDDAKEKRWIMTCTRVTIWPLKMVIL